MVKVDLSRHPGETKPNIRKSFPSLPFYFSLIVGLRFGASTKAGGSHLPSLPTQTSAAQYLAVTAICAATAFRF